MSSKQAGGMVDVGNKEVTSREAVAASTIVLGKKVFENFSTQGSPKGNVLEVAKVAAVMAAKSTPAIIPMCHPLEISKVQVEFDVNSAHYEITTRVAVSYQGRTGVEMEALTAASAASLTIYDMMKWADKGMIIKETKLLQKSGGKSGDYQHS